MWCTWSMRKTAKKIYCEFSVSKSRDVHKEREIFNDFFKNLYYSGGCVYMFECEYEIGFYAAIAVEKRKYEKVAAKAFQWHQQQQ